MKIYKHRSFHQWAGLEGLKDKVLKQAIVELENGLFEANLGSGLYKKRVALQGKGKSSGYRTLVAFKKEKMAFFVYGFAKGDRANIDKREEKLYRLLAKDFLNMDEEEIQAMIQKGKLYEVK